MFPPINSMCAVQNHGSSQFFQVPSSISAPESTSLFVAVPLSASVAVFPFFEAASSFSSFLSASISMSFSLISLSFSLTSRSCSSIFFCNVLIYSIALSTVAAFELLCCWAVLPPALPPLPSGLLASLAGICGDGSSDCISCNAVLMRFRRPCSAILCDVRFEVRLVESDVG